MLCIPCCHTSFAMPFHSRCNGWQTSLCRGGNRRRYCKARLHQPIPNHSLEFLQNPSSHTLLSELQPTKKIGFNAWSLMIPMRRNAKAFTSWAIMKAVKSRKPGRSMNDQLRDLVTKIRAWLTILTCKYRAAIISSSLFLIFLTPNLSCILGLVSVESYGISSWKRKHKIEAWVLMVLTGKKSVLCISQKNITVIKAR